MKIGMLFAWSVPELRRMSGRQLLSVWAACTDYSRLKIYVHIILLMACCSFIFNLAMRVRGSNSMEFFVSLLGLFIGLTVPSNIYFYNVFTPRRAAIRQFMQENPDEFDR